jgi:hypothetical protein
MYRYLNILYSALSKAGDIYDYEIDNPVTDTYQYQVKEKKIQIMPCIP